MQVDYRFEDKAITQSVQRLIDLGQDMRPITRMIAAVLASESETAFDTETDPTTGVAWAPLSDAYKAKLEAQGKTGKMLQRSQGGLALSLSTEFDAVSAVIGTNKIYGPLMQWGGLPSMPAAPAAVPARGYLGLSQGGVNQIVDFINQMHAEAVSGN